MLRFEHDPILPQLETLHSFSIPGDQASDFGIEERTGEGFEFAEVNREAVVLGQNPGIVILEVKMHAVFFFGIAEYDLGGRLYDLVRNEFFSDRSLRFLFPRTRSIKPQSEGCEHCEGRDCQTDRFQLHPDSAPAAGCHFGTGSVEAETSTEGSIFLALGSSEGSLINPHVH